MTRYDFSLNHAGASAPFFHIKTARKGTVFLWTVAFALVVIVAWSTVASIDRWARGEAILRPVGEIISVRNETTGRIERRPVSHGDEVAEGDLLWEVDTEVIEAEQQALRNRLASLEREDEQLATIVESIEEGALQSGSADTFAYARAQELLLEQNRLMLEERSARRDLERAIERPESARREAEVDDLRSEYEAARMRRQQFFPGERAEIIDRRVAIQNEIFEAREALLAAERRYREARITSPVSGRVEFKRDFAAGEHVTSGEDLVRIVPDAADDFRLFVRVPEQEAGEVEAGQDLVLRFSAFSVAEYGSLTGVVTYVPVESDEQDGERVFELRGVLENDYVVDRDGRRFALRPGMTAEARIITRSLPVYRFLLEQMDIFL